MVMLVVALKLELGFLVVPIFWVAVALAVGGGLGAVVYARIVARRISKFTAAADDLVHQLREELQDLRAEVARTRNEAAAAQTETECKETSAPSDAPSWQPPA